MKKEYMKNDLGEHCSKEEPGKRHERGRSGARQRGEELEVEEVRGSQEDEPGQQRPHRRLRSRVFLQQDRWPEGWVPHVQAAEPGRLWQGAWGQGCVP